jgi:sortase B
MKDNIEIRAIRIVSKAVDAAVLLSLFLAAVFSCYALWDSNTLVESATAQQYEIYKPQEETMGFQELQAMNPDVVGWLTVYGTAIDYPLLQGEDNSTYLNRTPLGDYALTGSIFLDSANSSDFSDFNTIIYGHNMTPRVMFGNIKDFKEKSYFDSHKYGEVYFGGRSYGLELFALLEADGYDGQVYEPGITDPERKEAYLDMIFRDSRYTRDVEMDTQDRILLLSTCSSDGTNAREILIGRLTDQVYEDEFNTVEEKQVFTIDALKQSVERWKLLLALLLLLLVILLAVIYRNRKKQKAHQAAAQAARAAKEGNYAGEDANRRSDYPNRPRYR